MENVTAVDDILILEELGQAESATNAMFYSLIFIYIGLLLSNIGVITIIITDRSLHQPMYLLFCNLSFNDILGNTVLLPQVIVNVMTKNRFISYNACATQVFLAHTYASASHTVLVIMAIDRYVAICNPLRYNSIMTTKAIIILSCSAWGAALLLVGILVALTVRLSLCRTALPNYYCDNASLFKLSCEDVSINNIYGLIYTVVLLSTSIGTVLVTYIKIAITCWTKKSAELNSKAIQTCASHLVLYLIMLMTGFLIVIMHRFPEYRFSRKIVALLFHVIPSSLNPLIYGLQIKQLRSRILEILCGNITKGKVNISKSMYNH